MSTAAGPQPVPPDDDAPNRRDDPTLDWEFAYDSRSPGSSRQVQPAASTAEPPTPDRYARKKHVEEETIAYAAGDPNPATPDLHSREGGAVGQPDSTPDARFAQAQANYVRHQIDRALDAWWSASVLPSPAVFQDGLNLLEAGGHLNESQRTLLLRAALAYGRGVHTALKHQTDSERVGLIVTECLLDWNPPLRLDDRAVRDAIAHPDVTRALTVNLRRRTHESPTIGRSRASDLLEQLTRPAEDISVKAGATWRPELHRPMRQVMFALLLLATITFFISQCRAANPPGMALLPAGTYTVAPMASDDQTTVIEIASVFVDRFEITNRQYRACVSRGACPWPTSSDSLTHTGYFTQPALADSPVVNVTISAANAYCAWQDKRLPNADEWTVAGGGAPATGQVHRFPWGEQFDPQRANSAETGRGDTVPIGSFRPGGDSPLGTVDMAGNVAEWTGTSRVEGTVVIKGGSFADEQSALQVAAERFHPSDGSAPWLGFRCARSERSTR